MNKHKLKKNLLMKKKILKAFKDEGGALGEKALKKHIPEGGYKPTLKELMEKKIITKHPDGDLIKEAKIATKTNPELWERSKAEAKAKMGGKHSARAMQLATQIYKKKGGGYSGAKPSAKSNSLKKWGKQKWQWSKEKKASEGKGVYLPAAKIKRLKSSDEGKAKLRAAERKKAIATSKGEQYSSHGLAAGTSLKKTAMDKRVLKKIISQLRKSTVMHKVQADKLQKMVKTAEKKRDPRLVAAGVKGYNMPRLTPNHPKKKGIVVAKEGDRIKTIRFGAQGYKHNYSKEGRKRFKTRHASNIARGKMSAAYWANKLLWAGPKGHKQTKESGRKSNH